MPRRAAPVCLALLIASAMVVSVAGCSNNQPQKRKAPPPRYVNKGLKPVPEFMKGTIFERADIGNTDGFPVSAYGLVGRLRDTGDTTAPTPVRLWMIKEMSKHGWGNSTVPGFEHVSPESVLRDPNYAIVRVDASLPPGARREDWVDIKVSSLPKNKTTSLSEGTLFETDLKENGANASNPGAPITPLIRGKGPIMVNPVYALEDNPMPTGAARASLRTGMVLFSGRVLQDRPLFLELREPQWSTARVVEDRINFRFQPLADRNKPNGTPGMADAQDEGIVQVYVPRVYDGDWEHFMGVVTHLYMDNSPNGVAVKARNLAEAAVQPEAPLQDISYCWEGLGHEGLPYVMPLLSHPTPEVAFAAARAAAFMGDQTGAAQRTLIRMARTPAHPFRFNAVRTLGALPASGELNGLLRDLLNADTPHIRLEAYKVLAKNQDSSIMTRFVKGPSGDEKFALDVVPSDGPPLIYATRRGAPRIAVIGRAPAVTTPITFTTMGSRLMISSTQKPNEVLIFFRGDNLHEPVKTLSKPDIAQIIARLGGEGVPGDPQMDFGYGQVVAIVQGLTEQKRVAAPGPDRRLALASLVLQESMLSEDVVGSAPVIDGGRPQGDNSQPIGQPAGQPIGRPAGQGPGDPGTGQPEVSSGR